MAGGGNNDGVFCLLDYGWDEAPPDCPIRWFSGDPELDPWEWRVRVLDERDDVAYSKLFFRKTGYITKEWYPYFLAARRGGYAFADEYADGTVSQYAKRIYDVVAGHGGLPVHDIKRRAGFSGKDKSKFEGALVELQMRMYITVCGRMQKLSRKGALYSWPSSVYCTAEHFWGDGADGVIAKASRVGAAEAERKITDRILELNPSADRHKIAKFIRG